MGKEYIMHVMVQLYRLTCVCVDMMVLISRYVLHYHVVNSILWSRSIILLVRDSPSCVPTCFLTPFCKFTAILPIDIGARRPAQRVRLLGLMFCSWWFFRDQPWNAELSSRLLSSHCTTS
jgi:hypothetical protein